MYNGAVSSSSDVNGRHHSWSGSPADQVETRTRVDSMRGQVLDLTSEFYEHPENGMVRLTTKRKPSVDPSETALHDGQKRAATSENFAQACNGHLVHEQTQALPTPPRMRHGEDSTPSTQKLRRLSSFIPMELDAPSPPPAKANDPVPQEAGINPAARHPLSKFGQSCIQGARGRLRLGSLVCRAPPTPPPLDAGKTYRAFFEAWSTQLEWVESDPRSPQIPASRAHDAGDAARHPRERSLSPKKIDPLVSRGASASRHGSRSHRRNLNDDAAQASASPSSRPSVAPEDMAPVERLRQAAIDYWDDIVEPYEQAYHMHPEDIDHDRNILFDPSQARVMDLNKRDPDARAVNYHKVGLVDEIGRGLPTTPMAWMAEDLDDIEGEERRIDEGLQFGFERRLRDLALADDGE